MGQGWVDVLARPTCRSRQVELKPPSLPVIANTTGKPHGGPDQIRAELTRQIVEPVQWEDSIRWLVDSAGAGTIYDMGPGSGFGRANCSFVHAARSVCQVLNSLRRKRGRNPAEGCS